MKNIKDFRKCFGWTGIMNKPKETEGDGLFLCAKSDYINFRKQEKDEKKRTMENPF